MTKSCKDSILTIVALLVLIGIGFGLNPILGMPLSLIIGALVAIPLCFIDYVIHYARKGVRNKTQKTVICPRCMINVDIESGICSQCGNKV